MVSHHSIRPQCLPGHHNCCSGVCSCGQHGGAVGSLKCACPDIHLPNLLRIFAEFSSEVRHIANFAESELRQIQLINNNQYNCVLGRLRWWPWATNRWRWHGCSTHGNLGNSSTKRRRPCNGISNKSSQILWDVCAVKVLILWTFNVGDRFASRTQVHERAEKFKPSIYGSHGSQHCSSGESDIEKQVHYSEEGDITNGH